MIRLVQAVDRLSQRIIVTVATVADRWLDARLSQSFALQNADVSRPAVRVMNQWPVVARLAGVQRLF